MNAWLQKLNRRERLFAAATLAAAFAGLLYISILEPIALRWANASREASSLVQQLAELQLRVKEQQAVGEQIRVLERAVAGKNSGVGPNDSVLGEVERIVRATKLEMKSIRPLDNIREGSFQRYPVEISLRGEAPQLFDLLSKLQAPENFLSVESMSVTVGNSSPPLSLTLVIARLMERELGAKQ